MWKRCRTVVLAVICGLVGSLWGPVAAAQETSSGASDRTAALLRLTDSVQKHIEELRGQRYQREVEVGVQSRQELAQEMAEQLQDEEERELLLKEQALLRALGVLPEDLSLEAIYQSLFTGGVAGYYDPEEKELFCIGDLGLNMQYETLIHELYHALQDQHFDLEAMMDLELSTDEMMARRALVEGDAEYFTVLYQVQGYDDDVPVTEEPAVSVSEMVSQMALAAQVPRFFLEGMMWPYETGIDFAGAVYEERGWDGLDRALREPPRSTEAILDPGAFLAGEAEPVEVAERVPLVVREAGYETEITDTLGQAYIELVISYCSNDLIHAKRGSQGWGGDRLAVSTNPEGDHFLSWRTVWDDERQAREFFRAWRWTATKQLVAVGDEVARVEIAREGSDCFARGWLGRERVEAAELVDWNWRPQREGTFAQVTCGDGVPTWLWWSGVEVWVLRGRFLAGRDPTDFAIDGTL